MSSLKLVIILLLPIFSMQSISFCLGKITHFSCQSFDNEKDVFTLSEWFFHEKDKKGFAISSALEISKKQ